MRWPTLGVFRPISLSHTLHKVVGNAVNAPSERPFVRLVHPWQRSFEAGRSMTEEVLRTLAQFITHFDLLHPILP